MARPLPIKLGKEPLVEAVFEVRFDAGLAPVSDVLPGFLYHQLGLGGSLMRLPIAEVPKPIRDADPGYQFAPTMRVDLERYTISIGDRVLVLGCRLPYKGWADFKPTILSVLSKASELGMLGTAERYALKYVNLLPYGNVAEQVEKVKLQLSIGEIVLRDQPVAIRLEERERDIIHIIQVIAGAEGTLPTGERISGIVVDADSIRQGFSIPFAHFPSGLADGLEELRQANKRMFFSCLTDAAIVDMEPRYE
jgi:uncharacterized protein (TIGR04255 family)